MYLSCIYLYLFKYICQLTKFSKDVITIPKSIMTARMSKKKMFPELQRSKAIAEIKAKTYRFDLHQVFNGCSIA